MVGASDIRACTQTLSLVGDCDSTVNGCQESFIDWLQAGKFDFACLDTLRYICPLIAEEVGGQRVFYRPEVFSATAVPHVGGWAISVKGKYFLQKNYRQGNHRHLDIFLYVPILHYI